MDTGDLTALCRSEWPRLVGALSLYTGDRYLAEELAQETLARLCRDWSRVQRLDAPSAWTHRVAMNLARSHWRRVMVGRRVQGEVDGFAAVLPYVPDPVDAVAVRAAMLKLPARQRAALALRYFADFSVRDVSVVMGCPEGTVKTLTRAGISALRAQGLIDDETDMTTSREVTDAR